MGTNQITEREYKIAPYETINRQLAIFSEAFNEKPLRDRWELKHSGNFGRRVYGAFDGEKLVGINGFLDITYCHEGEEIRAVESCDSAIDPNYQRQGIFSNIIMKAEGDFKTQSYELMVGFPNEKSLPGFMKMGWEEMCKIKKLFLPVKISSLINEKKNIKIPSVIDIVSWLYWHNIRKYAKKAKETIEIIRHEEISLDIYKEHMEQDGFFYLPNEEDLDWKLKDIIAGYEIRYGNKEIGFILVSGYFESERYKRANIVLLDFKENNKQYMKYALSNVLMELYQNFDLICAFEPQSVYKRELLSDCGFMKRKAAEEHSFIIKVLTNDIKKAEILRNKRLWNPQIIETDTMISLNGGIK